MELEDKFKHIKTFVSPLDLLRYGSLRSTSILLVLIFMLSDMLFYFHSSVIDRIGVNPKFNALIIGLGELSSLPWAVFFIPKLERKKIFWALFACGSALSFVTSFLHVPSECDYCEEGLVQMGLIALTRFCIFFFWCCIYSYVTEFYPVSILSIASGIPTAFGGLGISLCQIIFMSASEENLNIFVIAGVSMFIICLLVCGIPESYHMEHRDQIDEVKEIYEANKGKDKE